MIASDEGEPMRCRWDDALFVLAVFAAAAAGAIAGMVAFWVIALGVMW